MRVKSDILCFRNVNVDRGQISGLGHERVDTIGALNFCFGRKATKHVRTLLDRFWLQAEIRIAAIYVGFTSSSGHSDAPTHRQAQKDAGPVEKAGVSCSTDVEPGSFMPDPAFRQTTPMRSRR